MYYAMPEAGSPKQAPFAGHIPEDQREGGLFEVQALLEGADLRMGFGLLGTFFIG